MQFSTTFFTTVTLLMASSAMAAAVAPAAQIDTREINVATDPGSYFALFSCQNSYNAKHSYIQSLLATAPTTAARRTATAASFGLPTAATRSAEVSFPLSLWINPTKKMPCEMTDANTQFLFSECVGDESLVCVH